MAYFGKKNLPFIWVTPSGMKIKFALGKVKTQRAGLKFIREGSGVQINIINKDEIDVKKSVVALMPNFIHSLDASNIHELTNFLHNLKIDEIKKELEEVERIKNRYDNNLENKLKLEEDYLFENYTNESEQKDNTFFDINLIKGVDLKKIGAFKNNIPLYTIHDCFATTPNYMELIKHNVISLFSDMYFSTPYIQTLHISLLKQILSSEDIFGYPLEIIRGESKSNDKNDKVIIKEFKKVKIVLDNIIKINLNHLEDPKNKEDIFNNKYYLFTIDNNKNKNLIPLFPPMINENIYKYAEKLNTQARKSLYLIS
jgi:hypothetical protein